MEDPVTSMQLHKSTKKLLTQIKVDNDLRSLEDSIYLLKEGYRGKRK